MQTQVKLLLVDDDAHAVHLLQRLFHLDYDVFAVTDGSEALKIIEAHAIQIIVTDQRMPGMLGVELMTIVRQRSPATLGILLCDHADSERLSGAVHETGIFRVLRKPWNIAEIKNVVSEAAELSMRMHALSIKRKPAPHHHAPVLPVAKVVDLTAVPSVLVLIGSEIDRLEIMQMFAGEYPVHGAADVAEALNVMEAQDVGVIICEAHVHCKYNGPFLRAMTLNQPLVQTVLLTSTAESALINKMIRQVQIFRFVMKPVVRPNVFSFAVSAAMKEHRSLRGNLRMQRPFGAAQAPQAEVFHKHLPEQ